MTIDQELQASLDVEPSPEFVARVRTRIANEPAPRRWTAWWFVPASALAMAALVCGVYVSRPTPAIPSSLAVVSRQLPAIAVPDVKGAPDDEGRVARRYAGAPAAANAPLRSASIDSDVILDPRETAALRRLIFGDASSRTDLLPLMKPSPLSMAESSPVTELVIPELVIEPLPSGSEGARQ